MSYFGSLHFPPFLIRFSTAAITLIGHRIFSLARDDYKKYYIQYLVADFLVLQGLNYPEASLLPTNGMKMDDLTVTFNF